MTRYWWTQHLGARWMYSSIHELILVYIVFSVLWEDISNWPVWIITTNQILNKTVFITFFLDEIPLISIVVTWVSSWWKPRFGNDNGIKYINKPLLMQTKVEQRREQSFSTDVNISLFSLIVLPVPAYFFRAALFELCSKSQTNSFVTMLILTYCLKGNTIVKPSSTTMLI